MKCDILKTKVTFFNINQKDIKMKVCYKLIESNIIIEDISYNTYGIACVIDDIITDKIFDISLNKKDVENLCNYLNCSKIPKVHFKDIVEDSMI